MRFAFSDDQLAFRDAVRELLAKESGPQAVRAAWANATGRIPGLWGQLVEMGVVGMLAPEDAGGLGLAYTDVVLVLEETGRHALPEPIVETAAFGVPLLGRADLTVAAAPALVPWADTADVVVTDAGIFDAATVQLTARPSVDGARRLFSVAGDAAPVGTASGPGSLAAAVDRAVLGIAAQQCGLADRMIEMTVDHARERRQFGVPIGSFQAVKHHLANARLALEFARPLVYRAAATLDAVHVAMAKAKADDAALTAARAALQCHGAIGYTTEYDLHLFMKRAWALARSWGDAASHRRQVARAVLGTP